MLLPRSGFQGFIGQSCQKGADLAPGVIKEMLGVNIELMNADTETNIDTARTRAERLIQEGANVLVGPFDSGAAAAIAQVAEQRGVPFVINIAAAPQITEQGYRYVFRNFQTAGDIVRNGLDLIGDMFRATNTVPRTAVFMHVNDTFGQAMAKGIGAVLPQRTQLPFKVVDTISYDPAAKDLTVEVGKAKATKADFLLLVCRLNDSIILRREMVKQRWYPMGVISPGSPGMYEEQFFKTLGKLSEHCVSNVPWYNPRAPLTGVVEKAFLKQNPQGQAAVPRPQRGLHVRGDPDRRRRLPAREVHRSEGARRRDPADQHHVEDDAGRADQVQRQGPGRGDRLGVHPEPEPEPDGRAAGGCGHGEAGVPGAGLQAGLSASLGRGTALVDPVNVANQVVAGVLTGLVYGLMALGLSVIFGVVRVVNFAHGEMMTIAMYATVVLFAALGLDPFLAIVPVAIAFFVFGYALQAALINPFITRPGAFAVHAAGRGRDHHGERAADDLRPERAQRAARLPAGVDRARAARCSTAASCTARSWPA